MCVYIYLSHCHVKHQLMIWFSRCYDYWQFSLTNYINTINKSRIIYRNTKKYKRPRGDIGKTLVTLLAYICSTGSPVTTEHNINHACAKNDFRCHSCASKDKCNVSPLFTGASCISDSQNQASLWNGE